MISIRSFRFSKEYINLFKLAFIFFTFLQQFFTCVIPVFLKKKRDSEIFFLLHTCFTLSQVGEREIKILKERSCPCIYVFDPCSPYFEYIFSFFYFILFASSHIRYSSLLFFSKNYSVLQCIKTRYISFFKKI